MSRRVGGIIRQIVQPLCVQESTGGIIRQIVQPLCVQESRRDNKTDCTAAVCPGASRLLYNERQLPSAGQRDYY